MNINELAKKLQEQTGLGIFQCKKTLLEVGGDWDKAVSALRELGFSKAIKKSENETKEGIVTCYLHPNPETARIGVMVWIGCQTESCAYSEEVRKLGKEIAMQIASNDPSYIKIEDIPATEIDPIIDNFKSEIVGRPEEIMAKMIEGKKQKYASEVCLLEQAWIKDESKKVKDLVQDLVLRFSENITVIKFSRFQVK